MRDTSSVEKMSVPDLCSPGAVLICPPSLSEDISGAV